MKLKTMPASPEWLKVMPAKSRPIGVDRDKRVIRGIVVAERGVFKDKRGEFDDKSLAMIVEMGNAAPKGLKSRLSHPTLSDDGLAKYLGRKRDFFLDGGKVRADLHLADSAFNTPGGDLGTYAMDRAEEDPDSFGSSLVLQKKEEQKLDANKRPLVDEKGQPLPALWRPVRLHASDLVDDGDAVHGSVLSADALPDAMVRKGAEMLNQVFAGQPREVTEARCIAWLNRYLNERYGEDEAIDYREAFNAGIATSTDILRMRLDLKAKVV